MDPRITALPCDPSLPDASREPHLRSTCAKRCVAPVLLSARRFSFQREYVVMSAGVASIVPWHESAPERISPLHRSSRNSCR